MQWSLSFDGSDDYVACGTLSTAGVSLTVEVWVKILPNTKGAIVAQKDSGQVSWLLEVSDDNFCWTVVMDDLTAGSVTGAETVVENTWYHVAATFDAVSRGLHLWVNGVEDASDVTIGNLLGEGEITLGWMAGYDPSFLQLAWVRISDSVRYTTAFAVPRLPAWPDAHTLAQWDFIEGTGVSLNNREGTAARDGVISGATWALDVPGGFWGSAYERWGDRWTILVSGQDRTAVTALESIEIVERIGSDRDTAVFRLEDVDVSLAPENWQRVQIWHGGSLLFGGFVVAQNRLVRGVALDVVCHCVDWTVLLDKRVVAESATFTGASALTVLKDITELNWIPEMDATLYTDEGATGLDVEYNYGYVGSLVQMLAERSGYYFFLREDEEGNVYLYFSDALWPAPFGLSTAPDMGTTLPLRVLQWTLTGSDRINKVYVLVDDVYTTSYSTWEAPMVLLEGVLKARSAESELIGAEVLAELDTDRVVGQIEIGYGGVHPGMTIGIEHSVLDVDAEYLVHDVRIRPEGGGSVRYELTVSNFKQPEPTARDEWRKVWRRLG